MAANCRSTYGMKQLFQGCVIPCRLKLSELDSVLKMIFSPLSHVKWCKAQREQKLFGHLSSVLDSFSTFLSRYHSHNLWSSSHHHEVIRLGYIGSVWETWMQAFVSVLIRSTTAQNCVTSTYSQLLQHYQCLLTAFLSNCKLELLRNDNHQIVP